MSSILPIPYSHGKAISETLPSVTHSTAPRVPLFCSYHILTSSVIDDTVVRSGNKVCFESNAWRI